MSTQNIQHITSTCIAAALLAVLSATTRGQALTAEPLHKTGIYDVGEKAGWTLSLPAGAAAPTAPYNYTIKTNNSTTVKQGQLDLSSGKATLEFTLDAPAMAYVQITPPVGAVATGSAPAGAGGFGRRGPGGGGGMTLGAAIAPDKLTPAVPKPADFDAFWDTKLKALKDIPINPVLTPIQGRDTVDAFTFKLDSVGSHAQGYLAKPKKEGKFPAVVIYQWAGVYAIQPNDVLTRASEGWLALDVDSHDKLPSQAQGAPSNYTSVGNTDKETSYFLNMYLRDARVIDYVTSLPEWDGKTLVLWGVSMGGQQSLVTAGLRPQVTHVIINVPSGADSNGDLHARKAGYPNWQSSNPKVMETALYFDTINFASRIKAIPFIAMGFIDTTSPPVGVWTVYNQIPGPKEIIPMIESDHNNITPQKQGAWDSRNKEVLKLILEGKELKANGIPREAK